MILQPNYQQNSRFEKLFFALILASEASAWVRSLGGNTGLKAGVHASALSSGNSDPALFAMNFLVFGSTALICFPKFRQMLAMLFHMRLMFSVYLFSIVSILWSADRANTFRLSVYLISGLMGFLYVSLYFNVEDQIDMVGNVTAILALLSFPAQYLLAPVQDLAPGWAGLFPSKNYLGNVMAIGIVSLMVGNRKWSFPRIGKVFICLILLLLSQSFTSLLCVITALGIKLYLKMNRNTKLLLLTTLIGLGIIVAVVLPTFVSLLLGASGKDTTFTGRDVIWAFALNHIALHPILGYGYNSFWISESESAIEYLGWNPGQAHNGYLNLALEEGLVGLGLLLSLLVQSLRRAIREVKAGDPSGAGLWLLLMVVYLLVHNFAEADFYQRPAWVVYFIAYTAVTRSWLPWVHSEDARNIANLEYESSDVLEAVPVSG